VNEVAFYTSGSGSSCETVLSVQNLMV